MCHKNLTMSLRSHTAKITYCLVRSPLSQIFDNETSPQNCVDTSIFFCDKPCQRKIVCGNEALDIGPNLALAPRHTKEAAYQTSIRLQLDLAVPIWNPHNETETEKVKKVQMTAARWRNTSSVDEMFDKLRWPSLGDRRLKSSLTFFY